MRKRKGSSVSTANASPASLAFHRGRTSAETLGRGVPPLACRPEQHLVDDGLIAYAPALGFAFGPGPTAAPPAPTRSGGANRKAATASRGRLLSHDDFHIAIEGVQEAYQALDREAGQPAVPQRRDLWLIDAEELRRLRLCEPPSRSPLRKSRVCKSMRGPSPGLRSIRRRAVAWGRTPPRSWPTSTRCSSPSSERPRLAASPRRTSSPAIVCCSLEPRTRTSLAASGLPRAGSAATTTILVAPTSCRRLLRRSSDCSWTCARSATTKGFLPSSRLRSHMRSSRPSTRSTTETAERHEH